MSIRRSQRVLGKRKRGDENLFLNEKKIRDWQTEFDQDEKEVLIRNAITSIGSDLACINSDAVNQVSHIFLNTLKKKNVKATNQGHTGRCWMFAGFNVFRHNIIKSLNLDNFEFSEVYLFFFDKLERCRSFIQWFADHPEAKSDDRYAQWMLDNWMSDGSWWTNFANLVNKYGLIPKGGMAETWCSEDSDEMNTVLMDYLTSAIIQLKKNPEKKDDIKKESMKKIYSILVKFLGRPPIDREFDWNFQTDDDNHLAVSQMNPLKFKDMILASLRMNDFISLVHAPDVENESKYPYYCKYRLNIPTIVEGGEPIDMINVPIDEIRELAKKSILSGIPVWYVGDVKRDFDFHHSALDSRLFKTDLLFGELKDMDKNMRMAYRNIEGNHAMTLTGVNLDDEDNVVSFQCENSWSYYDNETPGLDGWLYLSREWFDKFTFQIVVHKSLLTPRLKRLTGSQPKILEPWESIAPAAYVKGKGIPRKFQTFPN